MKKILIMTLLITGSAFADYKLQDAPDMIAEKIETEIADTTEALKTVDTTKVLEQSWVASRIRFLIKPFVKFDAILLDIKVVPMLEFRWERKPPRGWVTYKPVSDPETNGR